MSAEFVEYVAAAAASRLGLSEPVPVLSWRIDEPAGVVYAVVDLGLAGCPKLALLPAEVEAAAARVVSPSLSAEPADEPAFDVAQLSRRELQQELKARGLSAAGSTEDLRNRLNEVI